MKKALIAALLLFAAPAIFAYCALPVTLANAAIPCASGLSTDPSQVHAYLWLQGKADWAVNGTVQVSPGICTAGGMTGGCDSDGVDIMDETCTYDMTSILGVGSDCLSSAPGTYYLLTDWSTMTYDGCPSNSSSERAILLVYDDTGKYVLQSMSQGAAYGWAWWDEIGTTAAIQVYAPQVTYYREFYSDIYMYGIGNAYGSYAAGDAPSAPLITGFRLYFYFGCSEPPTLSTSAWTPGLSYPLGTTEILDYDLPTATDGLWIGRVLIIDGKDAPFVTGYSPVLPSAAGTVVTDGDPCSCTGLEIYPTVGCWDCAPYEDVLVDGSEILWSVIMSPGGYAYKYHFTCNVEHSFQFRSRFGDTATCWSDPIYVTDVSVANPPVITSVVDLDPWTNNGFSIYYTPGTPAIRHDLYYETDCGNPLLKTDYKSGERIDGFSCRSHPGFYIAAVNDTGECQTVYSGTVYGYEGCYIPPEIAIGLSEGDALLFSSDEVTLNWPEFSGASGYKLFRGTPADLPNLPDGVVDNCCTRYDGTSTSIDLSGDVPAPENFFWYLVTAYGTDGTGSAGADRVINSSGPCP